MALSLSRRPVITNTMLLIIITFIVHQVASTKLNVPRVLLPYSNTPPSFILESESGCYTWTSTRPDLVNAQLDDTSPCQSYAVSILLIINIQ